MMEKLVWIGAAFAVLGVLGLAWCIREAIRAKRAGLDDDALKARLQRLVAVNLGALAVSALGLMCVIVGLSLS